MSDKNIDNKIKNALINKSEDVNDIKNEIWNQIEKELFTKKERNKKMFSNKKWISFASIAAVLVIFLATTNTGHAFFQSIKELFVPEKIVENPIEGNKEKQDVVLEEGKSANYVIYVDKERYKMVHKDNKDVIEPITPLGDNYPEVSMTIEQVTDKKPSEVITNLEQQLKNQYQTMIGPKQVSEPLAATMIEGIAGNEWNDKVVQYYVFDNQLGGSFIVTEKYFVEASEGHGARFDFMLKDLHIVPPSTTK